MGQTVSHWKWWLALPAFAVFSFFFPRFLIQTLGPADPWTNYLYLYGFGFFYTGSGVLLAFKSGACHWERPLDRYWMKVIVGGFFYFAALHALWIYLALSIPYVGGLNG